MINPLEDGITHINVYSKGATDLGRLLTNFAHTPFTFEGYGSFESVEGFWYWFLTGQQHNHLKGLHGFKAKQEGKKLRDDRLDIKGLTQEQKGTILEAIRCKLRQNRHICKMMANNTLPFKHYYHYGDDIKGFKVYELPQYNWIIDELERLSALLRTHYSKS